MIKINDFHENFIQDIFASAKGSSSGYNVSFFENICNELVETGELPENYEYAYYQYLKGRFPLETTGYAYDEEREVLYILTSKFFQNELEIDTLNSKVIDQMMKRAYNFLKKSIEKYYIDLEETSEAFDMAQFIYHKFFSNSISRVKILLFSDGQISRAYKNTKLDSIGEIEVDTAIIDINYLYENFIAENADSSFSIDINLPILEVPGYSEKYKSYLGYVSGEQIYDIYDKFGKRLLEQNVRTFLQFKGNVNKGIKNTLKLAPEMFFAYNNGITATASSLERNGKGEIIKINNLQIVNGGQTTSAIYAAKKTSKFDISDVSVQIKLSVINDVVDHADFVSRVAEYANTQNKVNKSDFFSNSPFHKEFKKYSQSIWVPSLSQERYKWFYERVRGEYMNEQAYYTKSEKKKFEITYPRKNKIEKTFLAKSEVAWMQEPHIVSQGAQKSFLRFAEHINDKIEKDNLSITEQYYKDTISKMIMFKTLEKIISTSSWFNGGFRANVVAYSISYLSFLISKRKKYFNFKEIWENQKVPGDLYRNLAIISEQVHAVLTNPPAGHGNPAQWSKKLHCWSSIMEMGVELDIPDKYLLSSSEKNIIKKEEKNIKKIDKSIEIQTYVFEIEYSIWLKIYEYFAMGSNRTSLKYNAFNVLERYVTKGEGVPSEKDSALLYEVYNTAINEGLIFN